MRDIDNLQHELFLIVLLEFGKLYLDIPLLVFLIDQKHSSLNFIFRQLEDINGAVLRFRVLLRALRLLVLFFLYFVSIF